MIQLNFPSFSFKTKIIEERTQIFDDIRRKYVALTPEEWVRQHIVKYLQLHKEYPASLMAVEKQVLVNGLKQRADVVVHNRQGAPVMIIECKAPSVPLTNQVFDQVARYNMSLNVNYLVLTNGLSHYCAILDYQHNTYSFLKQIPAFNKL